MSSFTLAAAQFAAVPGDVARNLAAHVRAVRAAAARRADVLVFPELSLTGYEPTLAAARAFTTDDARLAPVAALAREHRLTLIVGAPLAAQPRPRLSALIFSPAGELTVYTKNHLHPGEEKFFVGDGTPRLLPFPPHSLAVAICADLSHPSHAAGYAAAGATIYAAGVCVSKRGYDADAALLQRYAREHHLLAVMANYHGPTGGYDTAGRSALWAPGGERLAEAPTDEDAIVFARFEDRRWSGATAPLA